MTRDLPSRLARTAVSGRNDENALAASCSTTSRSQLLRVHTAYHSSFGKASPPWSAATSLQTRRFVIWSWLLLPARSSHELGDLSLRAHGVSGAVRPAEDRLRRVPVGRSTAPPRVEYDRVVRAEDDVQAREIVGELCVEQVDTRRKRDTASGGFVQHG